MWKGKLVSIFIGLEAGQPMLELDQVLAVPGKGLEGDRYYREAGTFSNKRDLGREVTLIEIEALEALQRDFGLVLQLGESRRNLVTRDVPLNHLVGQEFQVGEVVLRGVKLCEPCSHLASLTQKSILPALVHRGGLRAQVVSAGTLRAGDVIRGATSEVRQA
jgi:MOSC domain-containing protein YiiM